jgi:hypothetical protein
MKNQEEFKMKCTVPILILIFLFLFGSGTAVIAEPLWELNLKEDPEIKHGKIAAVAGKTNPQGVRFIIKNLSVDQPIQVTLTAKEKDDVLQLQVFKGEWSQAALEGSTKGTGEVTFMFRSGDHAAFKVTGAENKKYQMFVWVGTEIKIKPSPVFEPMDEFLKKQKASAAVIPATNQAAASATTPISNTMLYILLGGILITLIVIIILMVKKQTGGKTPMILLCGLLGLSAVVLNTNTVHADDNPFQPHTMTREEAWKRTNTAMQTLRKRLDDLGSTGIDQVDDVVGGTKLLIAFMEHFGLIDPREAAVQPNYDPVDAPPLPSRSYNNLKGQDAWEFNEKMREFDKWRKLLEDLYVIYKQTELKTGRIIELADAAASLSPIAKLKWTIDKTNPNEGFNKTKTKFYADYDKNYKELIKRLNESLITISNYELKHFRDNDWYNRYGMPYYLYMRDRYKRK